MGYEKNAWKTGDIIQADELNHMEDGIYNANMEKEIEDGSITESKLSDDLQDKLRELKAGIGSPLVASTAADMTDQDKVYVYTGSESGYTNGNWYCYDGTAWVSGGVYNSMALETDKTLQVSGAAADAKVVGDEVTQLKEDLSDIDGAIIDKSKLVLGNINASTSGWVYQVRNYGVITQQGYEIPLDVGTRLFLTDYTTYKLGISWKDNDNVYGTSGWVESGYFETTTKGVYVLNVQLKDTSGTASINDVYSILKINGGRLNNLEKQVEAITPLPPTDASNISRLKITNTIDNAWAQGVALVGNNVLMFNASNDQHTNHANIDVYDISDLTTKLFSVEHNLGHCASADYNEETDTLLVANGTYASDVDSLIFLIPNISTLLENRTNLEYQSENVHELNISSLNGKGVVACFGEQSNVIYAAKVLDGTNYDTVLTKYLYKLYVGKGSTNMVATFPTASVGTYTAKSDGIPNGTARVLMSGSLDFAGELQGLKYDGRILLPFDTRKLIHTNKMPYLAKIEATSVFRLKEIEYLYIAYDNGNIMASEMEDLFITDSNIAYVSNGTKIYSFLLT